MGKTHFQRKDCRLCEGTNLTPVLSLTPTPPANAFVPLSEVNKAQAIFPLDVLFCEGCHHVQLSDVVDPVCLFQNYLYVSGTSSVFVQHFREYAEALLKKYPPPSASSLVVDVGSNDGTFLRNFSERGYPILGVDPAKAIAEQATQDGVPTIIGFFNPKLAENIRAEYGEATIISANNVFAHVDRLDQFVEGVRLLLAPDGLFTFEVSYLVDVFENSLFDTIYHEHLDYHTVVPLIQFFKKHGLELIDVQRVSSHGGSIRCIAQHQGGKWPSDPSVMEACNSEKKLQLNSAKTMIGFNNSIEQLKIKFTSLIENLRKQGKRFAGFGAPAKATTLMYHFDIGPDIIDFVVDDSPLKQNMFTPGMHIPIYSSDVIFDRRPDEVIILAWNFADHIIEKNKVFLQTGGRFIVPLPSLRRV